MRCLCLKKIFINRIKQKFHKGAKLHKLFVG